MLSRRSCAQWWGNSWGEDSKVSCAQLFTLNHHTLCSTSFSPSSVDQTVTCMNLMRYNCVCKHNIVVSDYPFPKGVILHQENLIQIPRFSFNFTIDERLFKIHVSISHSLSKWIKELKKKKFHFVLKLLAIYWCCCLQSLWKNHTVTSWSILCFRCFRRL